MTTPSLSVVLNVSMENVITIFRVKLSLAVTIYKETRYHNSQHNINFDHDKKLKFTELFVTVHSMTPAFAVTTNRTQTFREVQLHESSACTEKS